MYMYEWYQSANFTLELSLCLLSFQFLWPLKSNRWQQGYIRIKHPSVEQILHLTAVWQKQCIPDWKALNVRGCTTTVNICGSKYSMFNIFYTGIFMLSTINQNPIKQCLCNKSSYLQAQFDWLLHVLINLCPIGEQRKRWCPSILCSHLSSDFHTGRHVSN